MMTPAVIKIDLARRVHPVLVDADYLIGSLAYHVANEMTGDVAGDPARPDQT